MQNPLQQSWSRLRSVIKECLTFAQIKDAAGSAGLDVGQLAHLQQKQLPEKGASKGELIDEVGRLYAAQEQTAQVEVIEVFVRECVRKTPGREAEIESELTRSGFVRTGAGALEIAANRESERDSPQPTSTPATGHPASKAKNRPVVFVSYSHSDSKFKDEFEKHLKALAFNGKLSFWSDDQISPGAAWFQEINEALNAASVAVLLVTSSFLASDFIRNHEMKPILTRHGSGNLKLIWIPVRACNWDETPLSALQAAIPPGKPLAEMKAERDGAWVKICRAVKNAASE